MSWPYCRPSNDAKTYTVTVPSPLGRTKPNAGRPPPPLRGCGRSAVSTGNWTLHLRRFTRLSNGFSRKRSNLRAALALYFAYYNFCRCTGRFRMTPAMKAGIARKPWSLAELLAAAQATTA